MTPDGAKQEFDKSVAHIIATYRYCADAIPRAEIFATNRSVRVGKFEFSRPSQADAMRIELGWAFFCRLDACLDALINRLKIPGKKVTKIVEDSGEFSEGELEGVHIARYIRNALHHGDGDQALTFNPQALKLSEKEEPHLFSEEIERFRELFLKIADCLTRYSEDQKNRRTN